MSSSSLVLISFVLAIMQAASGPTTIKAQARPAPTPAWNKGILPISPESYYNAIECGKQGGQDPPCVFYDTGLCKNSDFALALYTPYKSVAYEVWRVVSQKQPPPQPNYQQAQQTRVTVGVTPVRGSTQRVHRSRAEARWAHDRSRVENEHGRRRPIHLRLSGVRRHRKCDARAGGQDQNDLVPHRAARARPVPLIALRRFPWAKR